MSQSKFKVGDKVVCVDASETGGMLVEGQGYTVADTVLVSNGAHFVQLCEVGNQEWYTNRFELVERDEWCGGSTHQGEVVMAAEAEAGLNPKLAQGNLALPMTAVSPLFCAHVALAKHNGRGKHGGSNFIGTKVLMSTYLDAIQRHLDKIRMGEVVDEVDGVNHFGAIGANADIIVCAQAAGTLVDDRLRCDGQLEAYKALTPMVKRLNELHKDKKPKHYYMKDKEKGSAV